MWLFGSVPFGCAVFCGRGEGYIIGGCYTASLVTRVTDVAATIYEDRFCPFFFHARSPYNGELGRKLWPLGPRSRPAILRNHRSRLSIQHRATYAFVRCIFMRLIIFFLFPFLLPPVSPPPPLLEPLSGRIMDSRPTRLPRSLSPSRIRNKSGPFSARLLSAIVLFASLYRANRFFCHDRRTFCGTSRSSANAANETHER